MSSRRVEDAPPDPADVEDMRLRIEAHQRASEAEAASARAFRSECERAHGEFLRACARLEEERRARHAKQLEVMEATYARARLATPAVSAESLALRGLARGIARGLAARESARGGTLREDEGVVDRPEENAASKNAASTASDRFALAALERAASEAESRARETYVARVAGDMQARCAAIKKTHDREAVEFAAARGDAERAILAARNQAASRRFRVESGDVEKTRLQKTSHAALVADAAARATRAATAAARAIAERSEKAHAETRRDAARVLLVLSKVHTRDGVSGPDAVANATRAARGGVFVRGGPASPRLASPRRTRLTSEKARRIERAARASFAKGVGSARDGGDERFSPIETRRRRKKPNRVATSSDERRAGVLVFGPDDDAFSDDARFVTARGGYADARVDDDDDHDGGVRSVREGTTHENEGEKNGSLLLTPSSSSSSSSSDDSSEAEAVATETASLALSFGFSDASTFNNSVRFAAPGNRHRRDLRSRARVGEARVAALGARGDDSKGFGALGEAGVAFAESRPAGRRNQTRAKVFGDAFFAKASSSKETKTPSFVRSNEDTSLGNGGPVAIESDVPDDASRRNRAKKQSDASLWSAFSDDDDDASTSRVFQTRLASSSDVRARRSPIDDGFGLARCRGSGLRLPPPPASLPRAAEAPSLSRVIHDRRVAAARARGATTTIREARRGLGEKTWR